MHEDKHIGVCCWAKVGRGEAALVVVVVAWGRGIQSSRNLRLAWLLLYPVWKAAPISALSTLYQQ